MDWIEDVAALEALYGAPSKGSLDKVVDRLTPLYRAWIEASRFCILSTVGPEGTDASPRGDAGQVVRVQDDRTLWLPDWSGNNRTDSLRNIVRDGRVSLMFMVPGSTNVVRVNGAARLTASPEATGAFEQSGKHPRTVAVIGIAEVYFQCAKAVMRSQLWQGGAAEVPSAGDFLKEQKVIEDAAAYDEGYPDYARPKMW